MTFQKEDIVTNHIYINSHDSTETVTVKLNFNFDLNP